MLNDGDCGFCMRTAALVPRLGVDVDASTIQAADLAALGVDADRALVEMPYVHPDGRVDYGHRAFAAILGTGPLPWRVAGRLMTTRLVDPAARRAYHWVATHRSRLPGGTAACAIEPAAPGD
jgi:predicted DCC family thiol-disulfide oxidoreductase YuxK